MLRSGKQDVWEWSQWRVGMNIIKTHYKHVWNSQKASKLLLLILLKLEYFNINIDVKIQILIKHVSWPWKLRPDEDLVACKRRNYQRRSKFLTMCDFDFNVLLMSVDMVCMRMVKQSVPGPIVQYAIFSTLLLQMKLWNHMRVSMGLREQFTVTPAFISLKNV